MRNPIFGDQVPRGGYIRINQSICVAKTKALIRCALTAQLISAFVFAYAQRRLNYLCISQKSGNFYILFALYDSIKAYCIEKSELLANSFNVCQTDRPGLRSQFANSSNYENGAILLDIRCVEDILGEIIVGVSWIKSNRNNQSMFEPHRMKNCLRRLSDQVRHKPGYTASGDS